jgi:hypothetical protein
MTCGDVAVGVFNRLLPSGGFGGEFRVGCVTERGCGTLTTPVEPHVQDGMDDEEAQALWAEGFDPMTPRSSRR